MTISINCSIKP